MALFTVTKATSALSTSGDLVTIVAAATKPLYIHSVSIEGAGTASAANEVVMARSTNGGGGSTGGGAITPGPNDPGSSAASFAAYTSWSGAQPTLGQVLWRFEVNANGGVSKRETPPGMSFFVPVGGYISFRSASGTSSVVFNAQIEEIG